MKLKTSIVMIIIAISAILLFSFQQKQNKSNPSVQKNIFNTLTDERGAVIVEATPKTLEPGKQIEIELKMDTHSVDLDYDLREISRLSDNKGNIYKPLSWSGGKGGHHLEGILIFSPLSISVNSVKLTITGIDNNDRNFTWDVQPSQ